MEIDWPYIQEHFDWLGHIVEAFVMAMIVAAIARVLYRWRDSILIGPAFAIGHFHGREKRDFEVSVAMPPPHLEGYYLWRWSWDQATDFWPTAVIMVLVMIVASRILRDRH